MRIRLMLLLLICLALSGCTADPIAPMADATVVDMPAPVVEDLPTEETAAVLWFRYGEEPLLASETRELSVSRAETEALPLLRALLEGPSAASTELSGLFPQGTQVISVAQTGRVTFVTLSHHILNTYSDEPADWRSQAYWAVEVPLRRQLAMQSIAATLTENCDTDAVIILVEEKNSASDSLRLRNSYFTLEDEGIAEPLRRDESLLLTPQRTAEVILQCWQESDWLRLYRYIARTDASTGAARPSEEDFIQLMSELPHLLRYDVAGGSASGSRAVFTVSGAYLADGAEQSFSGRVLHLTKEKGLWRVSLTQLTERGTTP